MKLSLVAVILAATVAAATAQERDFNRQVDQTNFIVGSGCSGTLISRQYKLILTNYHCIDGFVEVKEEERVDEDGTVEEVRVEHLDEVPVSQKSYREFETVSTATYTSEIVGYRQEYDLALLEVKADLPHNMSSQVLPPGRSFSRGDVVYVVGNPAGMEGTIVQGIISNLNRTFEFSWTGERKLPMIQFSGGTFFGNSGGALYNEEGMVIGVPAAMHPIANFIGLAVPAHIIHKAVAEMCWAERLDLGDNADRCDDDADSKKEDDD